MEEKHAIILSSYIANRNNLLVLDSHDGVCCLFFKRQPRCCCGDLVTYSLRTQGRYCFVDDMFTNAAPALAHVDALFFLHQVLEICRYSVPEGDEARAVFNLLLTLYGEKGSCLLGQQRAFLSQKIFLCKLFILLGLYPDDKKFQKLYFNRIIHESIDSLMDQPIDLKYAGELDEWIRACFAIHPNAKSFKTIRCMVNK